MRKIEGRVAVVTGAAGGIGRETARLLAERGCAVALVDIAEDGVETLAGELRARGHKVSTHVIDVADRGQMSRLPNAVIDEHGHVHIVVNNAGVALGQTLEELSWEDIDWLVGINFWGVVHGCKFFLPSLLREDEGHIVNLSSMFGFAGLPSQGPYCATKAAIRSLSETLHGELAGTRVGVTSVHPGGIRTNIAHHGRFDDPERRKSAVDLIERRGAPPERVAERIVAAILGNRLRVVITPEAHVLDWAKRILPVTTQRLLRRFWSQQVESEPTA